MNNYLLPKRGEKMNIITFRQKHGQKMNIITFSRKHGQKMDLLPFAGNMDDMVLTF